MLEQHFAPSPPVYLTLGTWDGILPWVADASLALQPWPIGPGYPLGFYDPGLQFTASGPAGNPTPLTESPGLLSVTLECPSGGTATLPNFVPNSGRVEAVLNGPVGIPPELSPPYAAWEPTSPIAKQFGPGSANTLQARLAPLTGNSPNWNGGPVSLLVRSGRNYHLNVYYTTGNFWWSDAINWEVQMPNVPEISSDPNAVVQPCNVLPVVVPMIICDLVDPGNCAFPNVNGKVGMSGETVWPEIVMGVYDGPLANYRITPPNTVMNSSDCNAFAITNIVPSDFFSANWPVMGVATRPYYAQGSMNFGTYSAYEYFDTPRLTGQFLYCNDNYDLIDQFCMCPGHVTGNIQLAGPPDFYTLPSGFRDLVLYSSAGGNFSGTGELNNGDHSLSGSSHISASNPDGGGARVLFGGPPPVLTSGGCIYSASYDLRLAGLKPATTSQWSPNILDLIFRNTLAAPDQFLNESVQITDDSFKDQTITCSQSITHDLNYCFGEVLITVVNNAPGVTDAEFAGLSVVGSGESASGAYGVNFQANGKVTADAPAGSKGQIRLFLPEGKYIFQTTVNTHDGGSHNQPTNTVTVICGGITTCSNGCVDVLVGEVPPCTTDSLVSLDATITLQNPGDNVTVSYTVHPNALTSVDVTTLYTTAGGSGNLFTIPGIPLSPCLNQIDVTVVDHTLGVSTTVTRYTSQPSATPPTITGCQDIIVNVPPGTAPIPVNYNVAVTAGCPGVSLTCNPPAPGPFPLGTTLVTCTAIDACSNTTTCTFNVIVRSCAEITSDSFACTNLLNANGMPFTYSFTVNNPADGTPIDHFSLTPASSCFSFDPPLINPANPIQPGDSATFNTVLIVGPDCPKQLCFDIDLFDELGDSICASSQCIDNPGLPVIACPGDITNNCTDVSGALVTYTIPTATSLCCSNVAVSCSPPSGWFPIGVTPVVCSAVDSCGHSNSCTFHVTVIGHGDNENGRWVKADGITSVPDDSSRANAIAVDAAGNAFVGGTFAGTALFGSTPLTAPPGVEDVFLAKYNSQGTLLWVRQAGGGTGKNGAMGVAVDSKGNCYVTGYFSSFADFSGRMISGFSSGQEIFVAKYDPQGNVLWVFGAGGLGPDSGAGVAVDAQDNCYVTGEFHGAATFDDQSGSPATIWGSGSRDCFIAKYDPLGALQWLVDSDGNGSYLTDGKGIAVNADGTKVWITGFFTGSPQFGATTLYPSTGFGNAFVAQYDCPPMAVSSWTWARQVFCPSGSASCGSHSGQQIGVDTAGNCYFTAIYDGTAAIAADNLNPTSPAFIVPPNSFYNFLVGSFDMNGTPRWLTSGNGVGDDEANALAVSPDPVTGNVFVTGFLYGSGLFVDGGRNVFLNKYNSQAGALEWSGQAGGTSASQENAGRAVALDGGGCVYIAGSFTDSSLTFSGFPSPTPNPVLRLNAGIKEMFVGKYCPECSNCIPPYVIVAPTAQATTVPASINHPITFTVVVGGTPTISFYWLRNGLPFTSQYIPNPQYVAFNDYPSANNTRTATLTLTGNPGTGLQDLATYSVGFYNPCVSDYFFWTTPVGIVYFVIHDPHIYDPAVGFKLNVTAPTGTPYQVQYRDDLKPGTLWQVLTNSVGTGTNAVIIDFNPNPTNRFYRILP